MALHGITYDEIGRLSVDSQGRLYWDGKEVVTTMALPWIVQVAAVVAAASTVVIAVAAVAALFL